MNGALSQRPVWPHPQPDARQPKQAPPLGGTMEQARLKRRTQRVALKTTRVRTRLPWRNASSGDARRHRHPKTAERRSQFPRSLIGGDPGFGEAVRAAGEKGAGACVIFVPRTQLCASFRFPPGNPSMLSLGLLLLTMDFSSC
eukprot:scaffold71014_cov32-Tisochrysis_lutea.AAC.4